MTRELDAQNIEAKDANIQDATLLHIMTKELNVQNIEAKDANIKVVTLLLNMTIELDAPNIVTIDANIQDATLLQDMTMHCHKTNRCQNPGCNTAAAFDNTTHCHLPTSRMQLCC